MTRIAERKGLDHKPAFVNLADGFAKRFRALPGARSMLLFSGVAILICTVSAPFGTGSINLLRRLAFWTTSIAAMGLLWRCWFALTVRSPKDWSRAVLFGTPIMLFPLPLIIHLSLRMVGANLHPEYWVIWPQSLAIGVGIGALVLTAMARREAQHPANKKGALFRAGVTDTSRLMIVQSEDHYLRLGLEGGRELLVHGRFVDVADELSTLDGSLVRRGVWIAARALDRFERENRRLIAVLHDGRRFAVSPTGKDAMKSRGWLANPATMA